jgi:hypothetical protein
MGDLTVAADDERPSRGEQAAAKLSRRHAKGLGDLALRVGQQREVQIMRLLKLLVALDRIAAHADDFNVLVLELLLSVAIAARLLGAARRHVLGIEIDDQNLLAEVVLRLPRLPFIGLSRECGGLVAWLELDRLGVVLSQRNLGSNENGGCREQ